MSARKNYRLKKRGDIFYYKLPSMTSFQSTGETKLPRAEFFAQKEAMKTAADPGAALLPATSKPVPTLRQYTADFFVPGKCAWLAWRQGASSLPGDRYVENCRRYLVKDILPAWGDRKLDTIRRRDLKPWILNIVGGSARKNHVLNAFRIILDQAEEDEYIDKNPIDGIGRLKGGEHPPDALELTENHQLFPDDIVAMVRIWGSHKWAVLFIVLAGTGMRQGEVRALRWRHVLWPMGALLLENAAKKVRKNDPVKIGKTKAKKARLVLLSDRVLTELTFWRALAVHSEPDDLIFPGAYKHHVPLSGESVEVHFSDALKAAKISANGRRLVPHSLRHYSDLRTITE